ncbi:MFS transporter [Ignatzschineria ureiclastica]|uniref:MFS transporter n=1 Tax=Ignatzschineria ureiclastica TaxID=472582 RepID=A0A2U2AFT8_9GAMM|nr:MFS transporter [Ignatzschineria ureiclastica]PWD81439.1 MFS transporter [Ignatzschineria ureiclastica]GHA00721.1 MFS transporter [Ignatzschineria ureiclastica]
MNINSQKTPANSRYWITTIIIFFLGWVFIYAGRAVFSPVMQDVGRSFNIDQAAIGGIMSLFYFAYTALQIPSGMMGDKVGRKRILVTGFFLYAVFMAAVSFAPNYTVFIIFWMLAGAAQGTFYGPQYALSSEAIPKKWVAVGSAIIGSGMSFGIALGYNLSSIMTTRFETTWQQPFLVMAVPVFVLAIAMLIFIRERAPGLDEQEQEAKAQAAASGDAGNSGFSALFKNRNLVMAYIAIFCSIYGFFVIITWLPTYLVQQRNMDPVYAANVASIVPWISIIGTIFFSYLSDKLGKRKPIVLFMLPLSLISIFGIVASESTAVLITVLVLYGFIGKISLNPVLLALCADNAPRASLSTAFGLYNFFGMSASIAAPWLTGFIADQTGNLNMSFYFAAAITIIGIIAMLFVDESKSPNRVAK